MSKSPKYTSRLYTFHFLYRSSIDSILDSNALNEELVNFEVTLETSKDDDPSLSTIDQTAKELGKVMIDQYINNLAVVDAEIHQYIHRNNFQNLTPTEKTLIKLGYYELKFSRSPYSEIINDYVELAKNYGKKDSYSMINGVLDSVRKSL